VLQLVTGAGDTGDCLARSAVSKIAFTGSAATAKKVMAACAENLTPMVAECGGKDAFIVAADADLDAAADRPAWGALSNGGQTCVGIERVYVAEDVYHSFLEKLDRNGCRGVRPGEDREADYGPMTLPAQVDVVERHVADALPGAVRPVVGGLASIRKPFVGPVILTEVPEESRAVTEETFGPTVTVRPGGRPRRGRQVANAGRYGLARPSVFARNKKAAMAAARSLRSGMTAVNSVISFASVPSLPFGGRAIPGSAGFTAPTGCREFSRAKAITRAADEAAGQPDLAVPDRQGHEEESSAWPPCCTGKRYR